MPRPIPGGKYLFVSKHHSSNFMNLPLAILSPIEIGLILVVLLLLFGAKKLPELARGVGKSLGEFHKGKSESEAEKAKSDSDKQA